MIFRRYETQYRRSCYILDEEDLLLLSSKEEKPLPASLPAETLGPSVVSRWRNDDLSRQFPGEATRGQMLRLREEIRFGLGGFSEQMLPSGATGAR